MRWRTGLGLPSQIHFGGITPEKMAFLLKPFAIKPVHEKNAVLARRLGSEPKQKIRGYHVRAFRPVWKMYLDEE